jgi:hypothetical protein
MNMPKNFNEVKAGGDFTPIELGGHHIIIKNVEETTSKAGKPMLKVSFDFAKNDRQADYMATEFKNDIRPDKKWPHAGTQYILSEDKDGNCSKSFKSFITAFENSNNCSAIWGDKFAGQFKNKKIGGVFGEVENEYNGKTTMRHELRWFCSDDKVDSAAIPEAKLLNGKASDTIGAGSSSASSAPDVNVADGTDEEVPW